ncbi:nucleotidyltransferase domain-containing protein [Methanoculleus chikugoensis]|uniref:Polymerase nucleotidyl transferase domain-containing protein n=1 Tax=Methanoculleus chikugoensis TaxID=118126 RepID=A0ABM7H6X3_9EURY|nr:nucleotidyltransferase domain-containing protein [Methanoculleus chikugoensis]BBL68590.1 hypothetical protein MchiMG62_17710 [Methanoculleus chikugoensis]
MRQRDALRYDQTLFRDRKVFEFAYMPDEPHHRDARIRELALLTQPALRSVIPKSAFLHAPPGTGKTAPVRRILPQQPFNTLNNHSIYYMLCEFKKFVGFRILAWFLTHPTGEIHINKLAREIGVSPGSVKSYADAFERDGLLTVTQIGTARLLALDNNSLAARELKRAYTVLLLVRAGIEEIAPGSIAVAVYGSTASGTFDEQSDIDILVIGDESQIDHDRVLALEAATGREAQVTTVPYYRWEQMKEESDPFVAGVLQNHIHVFGAAL